MPVETSASPGALLTVVEIRLFFSLLHFSIYINIYIYMYSSALAAPSMRKGSAPLVLLLLSLSPDQQLSFPLLYSLRPRLWTREENIHIAYNIYLYIYVYKEEEEEEEE